MGSQAVGGRARQELDGTDYKLFDDLNKEVYKIHIPFQLGYLPFIIEL